MTSSALLRILEMEQTNIVTFVFRIKQSKNTINFVFQRWKEMMIFLTHVQLLSRPTFRERPLQ